MRVSAMNCQNHSARMPFAALIFALLFATSAQAIDPDELLPVDDAFAISAVADDRQTVKVSWTVADGYYLYRHRLSFIPETAGLALGEPVLPRGEQKTDEFFGDVETYRGLITAQLPLQSVPPGANSISLKVRSQGCADVGVCYPPHQQIVEVALPAEAPSEPSGIDLALQTSPLSGQLNLGSQATPFSEEVYSSDTAFVFEAIANSGSEILARWTIAPNHYMYREQFAFSASIPIEGFALPEGVAKTDEHFGDVEVYYDQVEVPIRLARPSGSAAQSVTLEARYQGCLEDGICYPPVEKALVVDMPEVKLTGEISSAQPTFTGNPPVVAEQDRLASALSTGNLLWTLLSFMGLGLLLAFTPCVFPMVPILSGIIAGEGPDVTTRRAFALSAVYVLAMALTYTLAGVIAGLFGANLQAAFQRTWVIAGFSLIFVALAFAMFGFYELQLPSSWQSRLTNVSNRQRSGSLSGAGIMGLLSALIVGPCVAPPLAGALIYIGQTGDALIGGLALFALSLGMGIPLLVVGTSAGRLLPQAGQWMDTVKAVFGVALLALAVWMLERILPPAVIMLLWGLLFASSGVYLGALEALPPQASGWRKLWKSLGVVLLLLGAIELIGAAGGGRDWLRPLAGFGSPSTVASAARPIVKIKSEADLEAQLSRASAQGKPAMLDFYADWCVDCKRMDKYSFPDPRVQAALEPGVFLKADVTANDEVDQALMRRFGVIGPPAIIFFDTNGAELRAYRVVGYQKPERFAEHVAAAFAATAP